MPNAERYAREKLGLPKGYTIKPVQSVIGYFRVADAEGKSVAYGEGKQEAAKNALEVINAKH